MKLVEHEWFASCMCYLAVGFLLIQFAMLCVNRSACLRLSVVAGEEGACAKALGILSSLYRILVAAVPFVGFIIYLIFGRWRGKKVEG